ncbi:MAG TPA: glycine--tRNA ligase subunit beta [Allosphingosinicella sp.]|uniref:glycine--tRNA ligase subunit beta n=1 Tax=Allosphingosinicella sp. TaxID=2823234 RepID=UPI002EDA285E
MADFLLELLSEEIPARMQAKAETDLAHLFTEQLSQAGLKAEAIETYSTPRRLALIARNLPAETAEISEEVKGPRSSAPPQALEGFLRKTGLTREQLVERDGVLFAIIDKPGRSTASVLAEAVPAVIRAFPWPKSMRWGAASVSTESIRWVRPLQGIVALLGEEIVDFEVADVRSGAATVGHRFHHPGIITIGSANDYAEKLRACHVIIDPAERRRIIAEGAAAAASAAGLTLVEDEGLLAENAGLTEWPVPLLGSFDRSFLDVPREVIQLTMRTNQKYFACTDADGNLAPNFICTANIEASDGGAAIVAGNEKVLAARLSDAKFFWEQDLKVPLEEQAKKLDQIVFHEKLGTVADKVERVAKLARWLVDEGIVKGADADQAERAARLAKADLVTGMVGEFPELQGVIGGYLARAQGEPDAVADAVRDHYKPLGQGDEVPTAPVTMAVSLADKFDTLFGFFKEQMPPTGSKDPFALRRAALSAVRLILENQLRLRLPIGLLAAGYRYYQQGSQAKVKALATDIFFGFEQLHGVSPTTDQFVRMMDARFGELRLREASPTDADALNHLLDFFADRLKVQQREAGVRHDLIDAVFALGGEDDLVRSLARVKALQAFVETREGADLLAGYKRAANILKKEDWDADAAEQNELSYMPEKEEADLISALDAAEPKAKAAVEAEDFGAAMAALASLRAPVDAFFDKVTVNDPDPAKRAARLSLLARMRAAVHRVADFSKIEG